MSGCEQRRLKLTLRGESFRHGAVPISILAAKLQALQNLLFHASATVRRDRSARRGLWQNRYRDSVELSFIAAHHSDLAIEVEMPEPTFPTAGFDTGLAALDLVFRVGQAVQTDLSTLDELNLGRDDKYYLLRALEGLLPNVEDSYQVELENCEPARHPRLLFSGQIRRKVRALFLSEAPLVSAEEATIIGELVKIHVGVGPEKITVRDRGVVIDCFYPESLRDQVANLMAGSFVEVMGWATLDNEGRIKSIDSVRDIEPVSMDPIRFTRFEYAGVRYLLRKPISVSVQYADGLWVYHNEALNLWGYGERREEALQDLQENFAYLWNEFAEEADEALDSKARVIKRLLHDLREVETMKPGV